MADDYRDERAGESHANERVRRREEQRRRVRRQRLLAVGALAAVGAVVVALIISLAGGGGSEQQAGASAKQSHSRPGKKSQEAGEGSGKVRNATAQPDWKPYTGPVPIPAHHVLGQPQTEVPYPDLYVPRASFRKQMDWLDERGYEAV